MNDHVYVDNNLAKLEIFFKDIVYKDYTELPSYTVSFMPDEKQVALLLQRDRARNLSVEILQLQNISLENPIV